MCRFGELVAPLAMEAEYERSGRLPANILPAPITERIKDPTGAVIADYTMGTWYPVGRPQRFSGPRCGGTEAAQSSESSVGLSRSASAPSRHNVSLFRG